MNPVVLDASAILSVILREPGYEKLTPEILSEAKASTVNLAEVQHQLRTRGWSSDEAWEDATSPIQEVVPLSAEQAKIAGDLALTTRTLGLSLGDRACLALAISSGATAYTADRAWKKVNAGVRVEVIR
jgi:ribonuclease VapC